MNAGSYTLYRHVAPNGKVYIGITCRDAEERWNRGNGYRGNRHFWNAIRKYGWSNISHEILATGLSKEKAESLERALIEEYQCADPSKGYNLDLGGSSVGRASEETKKKISEASKALWQDPVYRQKVSASLKGRAFSQEHIVRLREKATGRKKTSEERALISKKVRGKNKGRTNPHARAVINLDTGEEFGCICEAAERYGVSHSAISMACSGKRKSAGGCRWGYAV